MRFTYKNNTYELAELKEPNKNETFDIIAIFKVESDEMESLSFINYFYGTDGDDESLIKIAKEYIDTSED